MTTTSYLSGLLVLRSGSSIPKTLAYFETHRPNGRDLQAFAGPQVAAAAGAALIDLEATEADEVHRLALADGTFDPRKRGSHDRFDHGLRLGGVGGDAFDQVSEKHNNLLLLNDHCAGNMTGQTKQQLVDRGCDAAWLHS
jgi:hypothetical protein